MSTEEDDRIRELARAAIKKPIGVADNFGVIPGSGVPLGGPKDGSSAPSRNMFPQSVGEVTDHLTTPGDWIAGRGSAAKQAEADAGPDVAGAEVTGLPGSPGDNSARSAFEDSAMEEMLLRQASNPYKTPAKTYAKEAESYASTGGRALAKEAFEDAPARRDLALRDQAKLEGERSDALSQHYEQESQRATAAAAAIAYRRQQDRDEQLRRQNQLDQATQFYSNDLADQGKFWTNPGNILSAIAFSLMPIMSSDPNIGIKTIQSAVQQDMQNRQHAASQTLGALQSNLSGYHKIAGDRETGDLLAEAEMQRIAGIEIQRIASKFESPISKKKAEVAIEDANSRRDALYMEAYNRYWHLNAREEDPNLTAARAHGPNGLKTLTGADSEGLGDGVGRYGSTPTGVRSTIAGTPSVATTEKVGPDVTPQVRAMVNAGGYNTLLKLSQTGPHGQPPVISRASTNALIKQGAEREAAELYPNNPHAYTKYVTEKIDPGLKDPTIELTKTAGIRNAIPSLQDDLATMSALQKAKGMDPEKFLGWGTKNAPAGLMRQYQEYIAKSPEFAANKAEEHAIWVNRNQQRILSHINSVVNKAKNESLGSAQSIAELDNFAKEVNPNGPIYLLQSWLSNRSEGLQAQYLSQTAGLTPIQKLFLDARLHHGMNAGALPRPSVPGNTPVAAPLTGQMNAGMSLKPGGPLELPVQGSAGPPKPILDDQGNVIGSGYR